MTIRDDLNVRDKPICAEPFDVQHLMEVLEGIRIRYDAERVAY